MMHECPIHHVGMERFSVGNGLFAAQCPKCVAEDERAEEMQKLRNALEEVLAVLRRSFDDALIANNDDLIGRFGDAIATVKAALASKTV